MKDAIVIGAGISGLSAAWELRRRKADVVVLEAASRTGGVIGSRMDNGFCIDSGPSEMMLKNERMEKLMEDMGLSRKIQEASTRFSKRFIVRRGKPVALPASPFSAPFNPVLGFSGKWGLLKEWTVRRGSRDDESVASFVRRRIGQDFLDYAIGPLVSGIFGGDPETLSMRHAFPAIWKLEEESGGLIRGAIHKSFSREKSRCRKRLISFEGGMQTLPDTIAARLDGLVHCSARITAIEYVRQTWFVEWEREGVKRTESSRWLVLAVPAYEVSALPLPAELRESLSRLDALPYSPVATSFLGYVREAVKHPLDGFGVLIPKRETRGLIGVLFPSSLFPGRAPQGHVALNCFAGGMYAPGYAALGDQEMKALVRSELARLLGVRGVPLVESIHRWPRAIPHFPVGYQATLDALDHAEARWKGLSIVGSYRGSPATGECLLRASEQMSRVVEPEHIER